MWIGRNALAVHFTAEVKQLVFAQPALEEGAGINAGCRMSLEVDEVATMAFMRCMPEMIETDTEQRAHRSETGDVAAEITLDLVRTCHHGQRIPSRVGANAFFERMVTG